MGPGHKKAIDAATNNFMLKDKFFSERGTDRDYKVIKSINFAEFIEDEIIDEVASDENNGDFSKEWQQQLE